MGRRRRRCCARTPKKEGDRRPSSRSVASTTTSASARHRAAAAFCCASLLALSAAPIAAAATSAAAAPVMAEDLPSLTSSLPPDDDAYQKRRQLQLLQCAPQYTEGYAYTANEQASFKGVNYACKPHPYTGFCIQAASAFGPGTGSHWQTAWTVVGTCGDDDDGGAGAGGGAADDDEGAGGGAADDSGAGGGTGAGESGAGGDFGGTGPACAPAYTEGYPYQTNEQASYAGTNYECKPHPYTGFCIQASSAFGPGVGSHWQTAWTNLGSCSDDGDAGGAGGGGSVGAGDTGSGGDGEGGAAPEPTAKPTVTPTRRPSKSPTRRPTRTPTSSPVQTTPAPTSSPTFLDGMAYVSFVGLLSLDDVNFDGASISAIENAVAMAIDGLFPDDVTAKVLRIDDSSNISRRGLRALRASADASLDRRALRHNKQKQRQLANIIDVDFEISTTIECPTWSCAYQVYEDLVDTIQTATSDGVLTVKIRMEADSQGVSSLDTVFVVEDSLLVQEPDIMSAAEAPVLVEEEEATVGCAPPYVEGYPYQENEVASYGGVNYKCRPHPYSGFCIQAASAFGPGSGSHWETAWTLVGRCNEDLPFVGAEEEEVDPTNPPTVKPTAKPSGKPTAKPTNKPSRKPTVRPTNSPTERPTVQPTDAQVITDTESTVTPASIGCAPAYVEGYPYQASEQASQNGSNYACRPDPYAGFCVQAASAFGPGIGSHWKSAWTLVGVCNDDLPFGDDVEDVHDGDGDGDDEPDPTSVPPTAKPTTKPTPSPTDAQVTNTESTETPPTVGCAPSYVEGYPYQANEQASQGGNNYACRPSPYSGFCVQAASAFGPGIGSHWESAWTLVGSCNEDLPFEDEAGGDEGQTDGDVGTEGGGEDADTSNAHATCGHGYVGNGICPDDLCCSPQGHCGLTSDHCVGKPTKPPTKAPTVVHTPGSTPHNGDGSDTSVPPPAPSVAKKFEAVLNLSESGINNNLLIYLKPDQVTWEPSQTYTYEGLMAGLRVMYQDGVSDKYFYLGDTSDDGHEYGLVNLAAFLAQSMKETIKYDACDENSWDVVNGRYPLSNACGQLGQSYQDYHCAPDEAHMECPVDPNMEQTATTKAQWYNAPAPLFCGPKSKYPYTGYWDYDIGVANNDGPFANSNGRTDVEGCCWWGRGVIQTTGVCNFGKLNYFLGKRAADDGRPSRYPDVDFCADPGEICSSHKHQELKWIAGLFYWVQSVQPYDDGDWSYMTKLHQFVDGGMTDLSFIDSVSGIVNRGCHNPPCGTGPVDGGPERRENFLKVLREFNLLSASGASVTMSMDATDAVVVDLSAGKTYSSPPFQSGRTSSNFFVAKDYSVGPTEFVWWGTTHETLYVELVSSCLGDEDNGPSVMAHVTAKQRACGSTWQMNAGRLAGECDHSLLLEMDSDVFNPWLSEAKYKGCTFQTPETRPLVIEARQWQSTKEEMELGSLVLEVRVTV